MKVLTVIILSIVLALGLVGCSNGVSQEEYERVLDELNQLQGNDGVSQDEYERVLDELNQLQGNDTQENSGNNGLSGTYISERYDEYNNALAMGDREQAAQLLWKLYDGYEKGRFEDIYQDKEKESYSYEFSGKKYNLTYIRIKFSHDNGIYLDAIDYYNDGNYRLPTDYSVEFINETGTYTISEGMLGTEVIEFVPDNGKIWIANMVSRTENTISISGEGTLTKAK